jgi:thymidylate kinase
LGRYWKTLQSHPPTFPFKISFTVSKALFFEKLWRDRQLAAARKPAQTVRALAHGVKQKGRFHLQNSMLITLSGIDGSGKSSQAQALHDACEVSHVHARIAWTRIGDTPVLQRLRRTRHRFAPRHGAAAPRTFSRTGWRLVLWAVLASADYAAWLQSVRWRLWRGDVVIADRYLCDFEVELSIRLQQEQRLAALLLRGLHALAPKPRRAYLLRLDPALSRDRKPACDCRNLDPADLQARYDALVGRYGLRVYDASVPFEELASALVHDALSTYMATFGPLLRSLFFENPWQLNPPARRPPHTKPGRGPCTIR